MSLSLEAETLGRRMHDFMASLYPICRSITGEGLRETLNIIQTQIPVTIHEVPTGTQVHDWTVPREWNIRDAYIKNAAGERVIDFRNCNLHVVNYSAPIHATLTLDELRPHLFSLPETPDWVPYRTSYYRETWGFCMSHRQLESLEDGKYEVCIDSTLTPGSLSYGEYVVQGATDDEVLISAHCCHPSLCNDNLSGVAVAIELARSIAARANKYTYRFVFAPVTIGAITWLALNEHRLGRIKHGLVLTGVGDPGKPTYKRSRRGSALVDRAAQHVLKQRRREFDIIDFFPYGYDERQYCSAAFNLPIGCLMRTPHGRYPQYHTSGDNLDFVRPEHLVDTLEICQEIIEVLDADCVQYNQLPKCEPQLGKRGLYQGLVGRAHLPGYELALLWVLNMSDGEHSLLDIAARASMPFSVILQAAQALRAAGLLGDTVLAVAASNGAYGGPMPATPVPA